MAFELFDFDNSYSRLPPRMFRRTTPATVASPAIIAFNRELASELRMRHDQLDRNELAAVFSGNRIPQGADPLAMAYAGHQFGHFVRLGDGRAILLGEVLDGDGRRRDVQLKGAGQTPFSRNGDGRAALGPVIREFVVSEAMHALGIRTTRALAAVTTGEPVYRDAVQPGAVLTRVAASHLRVGTFECFAAWNDEEAVRLLADHAIDRHYPEIGVLPVPDRYVALLERVIDAQAALVASWMAVGFIHGVMNTDNMTISGETIDYGPCAFLDDYDPRTVLSAIDVQGRYAYGNQPHYAQWNLARLAEAVLPLLAPDREEGIRLAEAALSTFAIRYRDHWLARMRTKLGLQTKDAGDETLVEGLLDVMEQGKADYTVTFRRLSDAADPARDDRPLRERLGNGEQAAAWIERWRQRLLRDSAHPLERAEGMRSVNPVYIPRNHRIEQAIAAAVQQGDFSRMEELMAVLERPYEERERYAAYANPPTAPERVLQTFCGT